MSYDLARKILRVGFVAILVLLLLVIAFTWLPVHFDNVATINQAGLQRSRDERIAVYTQRMETQPQNDVSTVATLQATLLSWEQEQNTLNQSNDPQVLFLIQESKPAYTYIDQATHIILNEYKTSKTADHDQITVVLQNERSYFTVMNDLVFYLQNSAEERDVTVAIAETVVLVLLIGMIVAMDRLAWSKVCERMRELEEQIEANREK